MAAAWQSDARITEHVEALLAMNRAEILLQEVDSCTSLRLLDDCRDWEGDWRRTVTGNPTVSLHVSRSNVPPTWCDTTIGGRAPQLGSVAGSLCIMVGTTASVGILRGILRKVRSGKA